MPQAIRCLIVDDSALSRKIVRMALEQIDGVEVIGFARDGVEGAAKAAELKPDMITMDQEMPNLNGVEATRKIRRGNPNAAIVMVSSTTYEGASLTNQALSAGAFDFVTKPATTSIDASVIELTNQLTSKVETCRQMLRRDRAQRPAVVTARPTTPRRASATPEAVFIGVSTGGPNALNTLLRSLPRDLPVPVVIVQHMPPVFTKSLADQLNSACPLSVSEATDQQVITAGQVVIAPGGKQLKVEKSLVSTKIILTDDPPQCNAKPSVDYLFQSAARQFGSRALGVILTGMGDDGCTGSKSIRDAGGFIMTQTAESCVVYGMPRRVVEEGLSDFQGNLEQLADQIVLSCKTGVALCK